MRPVSEAIAILVADKFGHDGATKRYSPLIQVDTKFKPPTLCKRCAVYNVAGKFEHNDAIEHPSPLIQVEGPDVTAIASLVADKFGQDDNAGCRRWPPLVHADTTLRSPILCKRCAVYNLESRILRLQQLLVELIHHLDEDDLVRAGEEKLASLGTNSCPCTSSQRGSDHKQEGQLAPGSS